MTASRQIKVHKAFRIYLQQRGVNDDDAIGSFLFPTLAELPSPFLFKSMHRAVDLVVAAIVNGNDILVWGDYDVDGVTATALLVRFFRELGVSVSYHIPNRLTEGYGLNTLKLQELSAGMSAEKLLITVDCGISNHQEIVAARQCGFSVIVTDHHQVPQEVPAADVIINLKQHGCAFPAKELSGVGVAFYLAAAIRANVTSIKHVLPVIKIPNMKLYLDLVSIGTIADVMPLTGANRVLAKAGFEVLAGTRRNGIGTLLNELDIKGGHISGESVSFQVAPAINAAGRLGESGASLGMLIGQDEKQVKLLAQRLIALNTTRKKLAKNNLETALTLINKYSIERNKCIVIKGDFHEGILGITAARLVDLYAVPAVVCCPNPIDPRIMKGSARAPVGFDLYGALLDCSEFLISFGGHAAAAGLSLKTVSFEGFEAVFAQVVDSGRFHDREHVRRQAQPVPLSLGAAFDPLLLENLRQLEPVGEGNPRPVFVDEQVSLVALRTFGVRGEHFKATVRSPYQNLPVVGFSLGDKARTIDLAASCSMTYSHMLDFYKGGASWKIRVENIWQ